MILPLWICLFLLGLPVLAAGEVCGSCGGAYENGFCLCGYQEAARNADGYYEIGNAGQLYWFAARVNGGNGEINAVLTADIIVNRELLSGLTIGADGSVSGGEDLRTWTPVGYCGSAEEQTAYSGVFDGAGHTISGLYFQDTGADCVGLFGCTAETALIKDLGLLDSCFFGRDKVGALAGWSGGAITNCWSDSLVIGTDYVGGLAGWVDGSMTDCRHTGRVLGDSWAGGLAGYSLGELFGCRNQGSVSGSGESVGGITGYNSGGIIEECVNTGSVSGVKNTGGIAGYNAAGEVIGCCNEGVITGSGSDTGGIVGCNYAYSADANVTVCRNSGSIYGEGSCVGGIVGYNLSYGNLARAEVSSCFNIGSVTGSAERVGGLVGFHYQGGNSTALIKNCFTLAGVPAGETYSGSLENCYYLSGEEGGEAGAWEPKTGVEFASGQVACLLGSPFGQNIDNGGENEGYPVFSDAEVYPCQAYSCAGERCPDQYSNYQNRAVTVHTYQNWSCSVCGAADPDAPVRLAGENRYETAFLAADRMKQELGVDTFDAVIVTSGLGFADALSGSYLASVKGAPILLSRDDAYNDQVKDYIRANLTPGGTVYILGGTAAVPAGMEAGLADFVVVRLAGENRYETNLRILEEAGVGAGEEILVCTGSDYADSLSASATGRPILLVNNQKKTLLESQKTFISGLESCTFCVIGGEKAVRSELASALSAWGVTSRLAGADRFATSVMVARRYFDIPDRVVLAYAWNYPDGLCGGPLAFCMDCPLVLTMNCCEVAADAYTEELGITNGVVLGGKTLICDQSVQVILQPGGTPGHDYHELTDSPGKYECGKCGDAYTIQETEVP